MQAVNLITHSVPLTKSTPEHLQFLGCTKYSHTDLRGRDRRFAPQVGPTHKVVVRFPVSKSGQINVRPGVYNHLHTT
jgi:hypothetical protein